MLIFYVETLKNSETNCPASEPSVCSMCVYDLESDILCTTQSMGTPKQKHNYPTCALHDDFGCASSFFFECVPSSGTILADCHAFLVENLLTFVFHQTPVEDAFDDLTELQDEWDKFVQGIDLRMTSGQKQQADLVMGDVVRKGFGVVDARYKC